MGLKSFISGSLGATFSVKSKKGASLSFEKLNTIRDVKVFYSSWIDKNKFVSNL